MKLVDAKSKTFFNFNNKNNYKDLGFQVGDYVRISKYKSNFAKGDVPNWLEELFVVKKVKNIVSWKYLIEDLNGK